MIRTLAILILASSVFTFGPNGQAQTSTPSQTTLHGAGSTFPLPLYKRWFDEYSKVDPSVTFNYDPVGSGKGQIRISTGAVDFGATDGPMSHEALANAPGLILHIPTVGGADVITFNLHDVQSLRLDGPTLAAIYLGKVTKWNDPAVAAQNPGVKLPEEDITVVHRADDSGTTYIFIDYLSSVSPEWKLKVGHYLGVHWPLGVAVAGSSSVTDYIQRTPGALGYIELPYALQKGLSFASIKNSAGSYIRASTTTIVAALATAKIPDDFRLSVVNTPGLAAYPITGVSWLLVYEHPQDQLKTQKIVAILRWALTRGQQDALQLDYAPLPEEMRQRVLAQINSISPRL